MGVNVLKPTSSMILMHIALPNELSIHLGPDQFVSLWYTLSTTAGHIFLFIKQDDFFNVVYLSLVRSSNIWCILCFWLAYKVCLIWNWQWKSPPWGNMEHGARLCAGFDSTLPQGKGLMHLSLCLAQWGGGLVHFSPLPCLSWDE